MRNPMNEALVIFGAGPHGRVVREAAERSGLAVTAFVDDLADLAGRSVDGLPVLVADQWMESPEPRCAALGIGNNSARLRVLERLVRAGGSVAVVVDRSAVVARTARLGSGTFVAMLAGIGVGCEVAEGVVVNTGTTVDHDGVVDRGAYLSPGVRCAGRVRIGACAFVGSGATIGPGVEIGESAIVGAGSVVLSDVPPFGIAYGVPARTRRVWQPDSPPDWRRLLGGEGGRSA